MIEYENNGFLVFLNILMFAVAYISFKPAYDSVHTLSRTRAFVGGVMIVLFSVFAFWGNDFFHIANAYSYISNGGNTHMEDIYVWFMQNLCWDYLSFRVLVWGGTLLLFYLALKELNIQTATAWFVFIPIGLLWESYARVSLAMAMMYYAHALWNTRKRKSLIRKLLAIAILGASYYLHKSAMFGIAIVLLSTAIKFDKKYHIYLLIGLIPLLYVALQSFFADYMLLEGSADGDMWESSIKSGQGYMGRDAEARSRVSTAVQYSERAVYYLTAVIGLLCYKNNKIEQFTVGHQSFIRLQLLMVVVASFFLVDFGFNATVIAERFFRFAFFPTTILLTFYIQKNIYPKLVGWTIKLGFLMSTTELLYSWYMYL